MEGNGNGTGLVPVYISLVTFKSAIQSLREHGLPPEIDRSAFGSRSGADQRQIMSAFKFLGLIDEEEKTQPVLSQLVQNARENSEEEKRVIADVLKSKYSKVFDLDLKSATPNQLSEAIGSYGPTGATRGRCIRFFIKAAEYSGIELSKRLTRGTRLRGQQSNGTSGEEKPGADSPKTRRKRKQGASGRTSEQHVNLGTTTAMKTISLPAAKGTLTVSGNFNLFELDGGERKLVNDIIDLMRAYEQKKETASEDA